MSHGEHTTQFASGAVNCYVLTLSDTRVQANDSSGQLLHKLLAETAHNVVGYTILKEDPEKLEEILLELRQTDDVEAILLTGGTGISYRDRTYEVVSRLIDKELAGYGELFRWLSYQEIGSTAMLSRAVAGIFRDKVIFAMPGSPKAVELAMAKLILPVLPHLVHEINK